jgi:MFS family permease
MLCCVKWLLLGSFSYGCLAFTLYSLAGAHANDWGDPGRRMQTAGALLAGFGIGAIVGPFLSGTAMAALGPSGLFVFNGMVALLLALFSLYQSAKRGAAQTKPRFVPQPGSQYSSDELYRAVQEESGETAENRQP